MPTTYPGGGVQNIASSTNATPVQITTTGNHGFTTGQTVLIQNHAINGGANGIWIIVVVSLTQFTLTGSVGTGVGAATGTATDYSGRFPTAITIPSPGDARGASSVNVALEGLADRTAYLKSRVNYCLYDIIHGGVDSGESPTTWVSFGGPTYVAGNLQTLAASNFNTLPGDLVETVMCGNMDVPTGAHDVTLFLSLWANQNGAGWSRIGGSDGYWQLQSANATGLPINGFPFTLTGWHGIGTGGTYQIGINGRVSTNAFTFNLLTDYSVVTRVWRTI
jgi:hypothetical protein